MAKFKLTDEQSAFVNHEGSAFISACPGAGKTHCIVERARVVLAEPQTRRGLAFLSFTNTAISKLQEGLSKNNLLPTPVFPHFIGTFDSFIWHYLVEPFGLEGCDQPLKVIPDTGSLIIKPYSSAQGLRLDCFHRQSGKIIPEEARKAGFKRDPTAYETAALRLRIRLLENGQLDFEDVRKTANENLKDDAFSKRLCCILNARFKEIIVDEAQDCNPDDLSIINQLKVVAKISTKVVCDPNQSIFGFRGGVSDELFEFAKTFPEKERLSLTGNFRSSQNICKAVHTLRSPSQRGVEDKALGELKHCDLNVHVLGYSGSGVSKSIGEAFIKIAEDSEISLDDCRLAAKTRDSGLKAIGAHTGGTGNSLTLRLADAVMKFHHSESSRDLVAAIVEVHAITLTISGKLKDRTYLQAVSEDHIEPLNWRGQVVKIIKSLRYESTKGHSPNDWIARARDQLDSFLPEGNGTIAQKLRNDAKLGGILQSFPSPGLRARTIHEIKGKEYQGVCVVLTTAKTRGILEHIDTEPNDSFSEDARELYVAASRAQKLLVIACPKSQALKLVKHLSTGGAKVRFMEI